MAGPIETGDVFRMMFQSLFNLKNERVGLWCKKCFAVIWVTSEIEKLVQSELTINEKMPNMTGMLKRAGHEHIKEHICSDAITRLKDIEERDQRIKTNVESMGK